MARTRYLFPVVLAPILAVAPCAHAEPLTTTLDNGCRVVALRDSSVPMCAVAVLVGAGSAAETPEIAGAAHMLEHLLFDGTARMTRAELKEAIDARGGYINAMTREDGAVFVVLMPREAIGDGLLILSEMLFDSVLPAHEVEKERGVVTAELGQTRADGTLVTETVSAALYAGTPYAIPSIGSRDAVASVTREELLGFLRANYTPNNMLVLCVGDLSEEDMLGLVEWSFGTRGISAAPRPLRAYPPPARGRVTVTAPVASPMFWIAWPGPDPADADEYLVFEAVCAVLSDRLSATVEGADCAVVAHPGWSELTVSAPAAAERRVRRCLAELAGSRPPTAEELSAVTARYRSSQAFTLERMHYRAMMACEYIAQVGLETWSRRDDAYHDLTVAAARASARRHLVRQERMVVVVVPESGTSDAGAPAAWATVTLPNGTVVGAHEATGGQRVAVHVLCGGRAAVAGPDLWEVLARCIASDRELSETLGRLGATLTAHDDPRIAMDDYSVSPEYGAIRLELEREALATGCLALAQALERAATGLFAEDSVESAKTAALPQTYPRRDLAGVELRGRLLGDCAASRPRWGTEAEVRAADPLAVKQYAAVALDASMLVVTVVGSASAGSALSAASEAFGRLPAMGLETPSRLPAPSAAGPLVTLESDATQSTFAMGWLLPDSTGERSPAAAVLAEVLSARLAATIRETEGLAYAVGAQIEFYEPGLLLTASARTEPEDLERALALASEQVERLAAGELTDREVVLARGALRGRELRYRMPRANRAFFAARAEHLGLGIGGDDRLLAGLGSVTPGEVRSLASEVLATPPVTVCVRPRSGGH